MDLTIAFKTVLSLSFMGSIVAAFIMLIKGVFKNKFSAAWHYYIWFLLIIRLIVPYAPESSMSVFNIVTPNVQGVQLSQQAIDNENTNENNIPNQHNAIRDDSINTVIQKDEEQSESESVPLQKSSFLFSYKTISIVWFSGVITMLLYILGVNLKFLIRTKKQSLCKDEETIKIFEQCKNKMRVVDNIPIIYDANVKSPSLLGFIKPKLLIAYDIIKILSEEGKRHVFLHELAHLKRKDIIINWVTVFVQALYWFNPIVWYALYKMREDGEVACDAYVLAHLEETEHKKYGQTIINLMKEVSKPYWVPVTTSMIKSKSSIRRRIEMIAMFKRNAHKWSIVAVALALLVGCVGLTNPVDKSNNLNNTENTQNINIDKLLDYKDSYVGDNSAVGAIIANLPGASFRMKYSLQTDQPPYGIEVDYGLTEFGTQKEEAFNNYWNDNTTKKIFLNNATTLFVLVKNVEEVQFNLHGKEKQSFRTTRKQLEDFYGKDLRQYATDKSMWEKEILEGVLESEEKVESFFTMYHPMVENEENLPSDESTKDPNTSVDKDTGTEEKEITVYFSDNQAEYLVGEIRKMKDITPKNVLEQLIQGPNSTEMYRTLPEKTEIIDVEIKDKIAYVNFTKSIEESMTGVYGSSAMSRLFVYSIVNTLTLCDEFEIDKVQFLIDGEPGIVLGPMAIDRPFETDMNMFKQ